jgi:hypothetical protein
MRTISREDQDREWEENFEEDLMHTVREVVSGLAERLRSFPHDEKSVEIVAELVNFLQRLNTREQQCECHKRHVAIILEDADKTQNCLCDRIFMTEEALTDASEEGPMQFFCPYCGHLYHIATPCLDL